MARYVVTIEGREIEVEIAYQSEKFSVTVDSRARTVEYNRLGENRFLMMVDRESIEADVRPGAVSGDRVVFMEGHEIPVSVENWQLAQARKAAGISAHTAAETRLQAPMPGMVLKIHVSAGQKITKGQPLLVIEAMKMENIIKAKADGVVKSIHAVPGRSVEKGDLLVEFESDGH